MARILLIDDESLVVETLSHAITSKGHTVVTAANGVEGMKKFSEGKFDLVITDIIMPDKEGIELIMELKRHTPSVKIVAISGGGRTGNVEFLKMATKLGAVASLKKPIRLAEFYSTLSHALGESPSPQQQKVDG
jgi:YesN/AraC family two-component response regulator